VTAVETSNSPALLMAGKKMIGAGVRVDPQLLSDESSEMADQRRYFGHGVLCTGPSAAE
jgi:hypothetical protein